MVEQTEEQYTSAVRRVARRGGNAGPEPAFSQAKDGEEVLFGAEPAEARLWVAGVPATASAASVSEVFAGYDVVDIAVQDLPRKRAPWARKTAVVTFADAAEAQRALIERAGAFLQDNEIDLSRRVVSATNSRA